MKKLSIMLALILLPTATFAAAKVIKEYKAWDNIAQIQQEEGVVRIYKVEDASDPLVKCYVATKDYTMYQTSKQSVLSMSCLK